MEIQSMFSAAQARFTAGNLKQAASFCIQILDRQSDHAGALHLLGVIALNERQLQRGIELIGKAVKIEPSAQKYFDLGNACNLAADPKTASECFRKAISLDPDDARSYSNLGVILHAQGLAVEAVECFSRSAQLTGSAESYSNLGCALMDTGAYKEAVDCFEKALSVRPDVSRTYRNFSNLLFNMNYLEHAGPEDIFRAHRNFGSHFDAVETLESRHSVHRDPQRRLRIGFVSGDFRSHSVAYFLEPFWAGIDPRQMEIWAYSNHQADDSVTKRLKALAFKWRTVYHLNDDELAEGICNDNIDILIDLSGHSAHNRLAVFARKPAPVQVSWLGYPGTTGLAAIDYYIADHNLVPAGSFDSYFTEKIIRFPSVGTYKPFENAPAVSRTPALNNGHITFGSFHRTAKLQEGCIALWCRVLNEIPDARMILGNVPDKQQGMRLAERFRAHGVSPERLQLYPSVSMREYLELHNSIDLILDTFPYAGCTTTAHAAWMGVPVLTIAGGTVPGRLGVTMLSQFGLTEFIADSKEMFLEKAIEWAHKPDKLNAIRSGLRDTLSLHPAVTSHTVNRAFETAIRRVWQRACDGLPPESFDITGNSAD